MGLKIAASLALVTLMFQTATEAADYEAYAQLQSRAVELFEAVQGDVVAEETREEAVSAYLAIIDWLDAFFVDPEFASLPAEHQSAAYSDRYRWEYNLSRQLLLLDRCEEARDRARGLLDSSVTDPELRPHLAEAFEESIACLSRPRVATVVIDATPSDAQVIVDGAFVGLVHAPFEVDLGSHTVVLQAEGFEEATLELEAETEGEEIALGPIALVEIAPVEEPPLVVVESESARKLPKWYEWTLWGVGAAGIATGVILLVDAASLQNTLDNPPDGMVPSDPDGEQDAIDRQRTIGYVAGGLGLACAITGTVLYLVRDVDEATTEPQVSWGAGPARNGAQVWFGLTF